MKYVVTIMSGPITIAKQYIVECQDPRHPKLVELHKPHLSYVSRLRCEIQNLDHGVVCTYRSPKGNVYTELHHRENSLFLTVKNAATSHSMLAISPSLYIGKGLKKFPCFITFQKSLKFETKIIKP
jgi:hypothetical protein